MEKIQIDIDALKSKYNADSLPYHLWTIAFDCKRRRDAYWIYHNKMRKYNNIISIPLLLLSSVAGATSVAQLGSLSNVTNEANEESLRTTEQSLKTTSIIITLFGITSTILTAMQKFLSYSEKAEHSRHMAKSYGRLARRIENTMIFLESKATLLDQNEFEKFVEEVHKDVESLAQEVNYMPNEFIKNENFYNKILKSLKVSKKFNKTLTEKNLLFMSECPVTPQSEFYKKNKKGNSLDLNTDRSSLDIDKKNYSIDVDKIEKKLISSIESKDETDVKLNNDATEVDAKTANNLFIRT